MNKVVVKELERKLLVIDIMLYCVFITVGFILLNFPSIDALSPIEYASPLFYMFAFFSLLAYFVNRRKGNYELLMFGFINVIVASFILIYESYPDSGFILADAVLVYSLAIVLNKGYHCGVLLKERNVNFYIKVSVTILLLFLGVFVVSSLYNKIEVGSMILGYYFIVFGLLSLIEPLMEILTNNKDVEKMMLGILSYGEEDTKKPEKKIKEIKKQKPEAKEKATEKEEKPVKKTNPSKKTNKSKK